MENSFPFERLGDYCQKIGSGATPRGGKEVYLDDGECVLIRSQNVYNNKFEMGGLAFISKEAAKKLNGVTVEENDVLLNITGDSVARCCTVPCSVLPARVNQHVAIIRTKNEELDPLFTRYFLVSPNHQDHMLKLASSGATRNALTKVMIEDFQVPKPDIDVQHAIAKILGDLDDKIDLLREMNKTLEDIARSLFRAWFVDFEPVRAKAAGADHFRGMPQELFDALPDSFENSEIGEIPAGWKVTPLISLVKKPIKRGLAPKYLSEGGICVLNQKCIRNHFVNFDLSRRHDSKTKPPKGREIELYDILVNSTGVGTLGRVAQVYDLAQETIVDSHLSVVCPDPKKIDPLVLGFNLTSREDEIENLAHGSTGQTELSRHKLDELNVIVPSRAYQDEFFESISPMVQRSVLNQKEIKTLSGLRDTLLPKLISGEIEAPDLEVLADGG